MFLASNAVAPPVPPDAIGNAVVKVALLAVNAPDNVNAPVVSVLVVLLYVNSVSLPKLPELLIKTSVSLPGAVIPVAEIFVICEPSPTKPPVAVMVPV